MICNHVADMQLLLICPNSTSLPFLHTCVHACVCPPPYTRAHTRAHIQTDQVQRRSHKRHLPAALKDVI